MRPVHHVRAGLINGEAAMRSVLALSLLIALCASANAAVKGHHAKTRQVIVRSGQAVIPSYATPGGVRILSRRLRFGWSADRPRRRACLRRSIQVWRRLICGDQMTCTPKLSHGGWCEQNELDPMRLPKRQSLEHVLRSDRVGTFRMNATPLRPRDVDLFQLVNEPFHGDCGGFTTADAQCRDRVSGFALPARATG